MNNYRTAMDEFDKNIHRSRTCVEAGIIPVQTEMSMPSVTSINNENNISASESTTIGSTLYLHPQKVTVKTYRLKK